MKDAYYFSHDSNARNDKKILEMRSVYGAEGYGWYFMIVEMMREESDYRLHMQSKYAWNAIAMQLQCDADAAHKFALDCIEEFKLFQSDGEYFWSNSLIRRMQKKDEKSEKARQAALSRWNKKDNANAMQTQCKRNAIKESKGKEKKSNNPDAANKKIIDALRKNIRVDIRADEVEKVTCWLEDGFEPDVLVYAIEQAREHNARNIPYINKILIELHKDNILTMEEVKKRKQKRSNKEPHVPEINEKPFNLEEYEKEALRAVGEL